MPAAPREPAASDTSYVRGSGGIDIDARRLVGIALVLCILSLAGITIATTVQAVNQNSRQSELRRHGVPVSVSVTGCIAVGSGVGQGISYYTCRGAYTLDGSSHDAVIGGTRVAYSVGAIVAGVAVPGHPEILAVASSVTKSQSTLAPFVTPLVLGLLTLAMIVGLLVAPRRKATATG